MMLAKFRMFQVQIARAMALFLGGFTLLNIVGAWYSPGFDANGWWIDVGFMPWNAGYAALVVAAVALLAIGFNWPRQIRPWARGAIAGLAAVTAWNAIVFFVLWKLHFIAPGIPVPLSLILTVALSFIVRASGLAELPGSWIWRGVYGLAFAAALIGFPLAQMYCFGKTDYRRNADAIVVFGARAYADGTPSQVLSDRVKTALELYKEKRARLLIFSGGPGDGAISESMVMRAMALAAGVPESAVMVDEQGLNTEATVANTAALFELHKIKKVLAVSHDYHLPRVKLTYARALAGKGVEVYTVPAKEPHPLSARPWFMTREVVALWSYYLRPLWRH